jgi:hypothetical protein
MVIVAVMILASSYRTEGQNNTMKLAYNASSGKNLQYESNTSITQTMDINGQTMNVLVNTFLGYKLKMLENIAGNIKYNITVDSLKMSVDAMQGATNSRIKEIEGKSFDIILTPAGKVVDISEAEKIQYSIENQGAVTLAQSFRDIFPILPGKAVKPGDTWSAVDTITNQSSAASTTQIIESNYKFEGIEKMNGTDCAKIISDIKGTAETRAQNMGMDIFYSGPVQGQVVLYFAIKEGYYVKRELSTKMNGTIEISGPENMSFPIFVDTKSVTQAH